ncbi:DUF6049 family protein [Bifidobacterium aerophilum]
MTALLAVTMGLATGFAATARTAMADEGDGTSADTTDVTRNGTNGTSDDTSDGTAASDAVTITIDAATPVVTSSSGYSLKATISNPTSKKLSAGTLTATTNARFTFFSRTDIQEWAEGTAAIPAMDVLGSVDVPELAPNATKQVTVTADQQALSQIVSWGPKPLALVYMSGDTLVAQAHSFLTRSSDGLNNVSTPAMNLTVVLPIASTAWESDEQAVSTLVDGGTGTSGDGSSENQSGSAANGGTTEGDESNGTSNSDSDDTSDKDKTDDAGTNDGQQSETQSETTQSDGKQQSSTDDAKTSAAAGDTVTLGDDEQLERTRLQLITKHPKLQVVADPTTLDAMAMPPKVNGLMQPAGFDITTYSAYGDASSYQSAGVSTKSWNADAALSDYRSALGDRSASNAIYAWQGDAAWSLTSLTEAKRQGYSTVIADHEFDNSDDSTVHTGKIVVPTEAGDVTVLTEQRELSRLAQGKATSADAAGEASAAGRLARFVAQSAFYQMEQPYTSRNLLVCFGTDADTAMIDALMNAVEQSPWLELTDLDTLSQADAYASGDDALQIVQNDATLSNAQTQQVQQTLASLTASRNGVTQFVSSIVTDDKSAQRSGLKEWTDSLLAVHSRFALHALSGDETTAEHMANSAAGLATQLLGGVAIAPSEAVTVVSETAKMMVTVSNQHPYPVHVKVSSITDSPEIVTSRIAETDVPAHGEAQVTFTIRVATSGKANATISLQDRDGHPFGSAQTTAITSVLRISDMSGFVIIGFAILLGLLGLWRQFHRKKDPDE